MESPEDLRPGGSPSPVFPGETGGSGSSKAGEVRAEGHRRHSSYFSEEKCDSGLLKIGPCGPDFLPDIRTSSA